MRKRKKYSEEHRDNISYALCSRKRKKNDNDYRLRGSKHYKWTKWTDLTLTGKHKRIRREWGLAYECEGNNCRKQSKVFDWANISGKYRKSRKDWIMLCRSCHILFDRICYICKRHYR